MRDARVIVTVVAMVLAGCGASPEESKRADETPRTEAAADGSKRSDGGAAEWARRADAVCARHNRSLGPIYRDLGSAGEAFRSGEPGARRRLVRAWDRRSRGLTRVFEDLKVIPKPPDASRPARLVAYYAQVVYELNNAVQAAEFDDSRLGNTLANKANARAVKASARVDKVAGRLDIKNCTPGAYPGG